MAHPTKRFQRFLRSYLLLLVFLPLLVLPLRCARWVGEGYGRVAFWLLPRLRRRTRLHLALAFPDWSPGRIERVARGVTRWVGRSGADFLHLDRRRVGRLTGRLQVEGWEYWEQARRLGPGVVAVTGHCGNWELLGAWLATLGGGLTVLYHPFHEERLDRWVARRRRLGGVEMVSADRPSSLPLRVLRRGGVLGVLIDRVPRLGGIECRFFGRECRAAAGPARLALSAGAPILPVMLRYEEAGYLARFAAPIQVTERREVPEVTQRLASTLEGWIREAPEQWPWFEDRWKVRRGPDA